MKQRKPFGNRIGSLLRSGSLQTYSSPKASEAIAIAVRLGLLERGDTTLARVWLNRLRVPLHFAIPASEISQWIEYHHQMCGRG